MKYLNSLHAYTVCGWSFLKRLQLFFIVLILTSSLIYQHVSATEQEIVSSTIEISSASTNGPDLTINDRFGSSIANIDDLNGDGTSDIIVGAPYDDAAGSDTGAIHVMFMNSNGTISNTIEINNNTVNGPVLNSNDLFGYSIANIDDLNGDGTSDIIVGAPYDDAAGSDTGAIHVMFMNSNGTISDTIEINNNTVNGPVLNSNDLFGYSIASIGDLNGDGTSDIIVGAPYDDAAGSDTGAIHVMFMNSNGTISDTIEINNNTVNGPVLNSNDLFGYSIANIGDLNGDGTSDIIVGAPYDDAAGSDTGAIHVMFMNSNGTVSNTIEINDNTPNGPNLSNTDLFGYSIANIGDWNNDGTSDIAVGAIYDNTGGANIGAIHIILLNRDGTVSSTMEINNNTANGPNLSDGDLFGSSVANIGDLDGNNVMDIAVGAQRADTDRGVIHIIFMDPVDIYRPTFSSATLDIGTGNLTITFNEKVNVHAINFLGLSIRDGPGTDIEPPSIVTPSITELVTTINDMTISFNMTLPNRQSLIAFTSYILDIDADTVYDLAGNAIIASSGNHITVIPDTAPPILSFTSIAPNNGTQSIGDDIIIQITTNTYEAGLTLLNATINNATPTFSEWVLPSGPDYNYRKTITINNAMVSGSTDHTDFPLLVSIQNDPSLNSVAVQASGQDIRFTTIDDTLIDYEITSFSNNHTSGSLSAWVKIPTLSASTDTQIHMYYSNPIVADGQNVTAVWDSDYVGVWHYDGDILDSTGNNNDGTNYDSIETTGIIGGGRSFDGNDYISYDDSIFPSGSSPRTLSAWVSHSNLLTTIQALLVYGTKDTGQAYGLFQKDSKWLAGGYSDDITLNTIPTINNWHHLAMTYDGTTVRAYVDGSLDISAAKSWNTVLDEFRVGQQVNSADQFFAGQLDEIRISDTVKTADWIKTEYDSQNSDSFYSVSVQQELVTPVYYNLTYNVAEGDSDIDDTTEGITYSITLSDAVGNPSVPLTATLPSISSPGVDANSPVITLNGANPQIIELGDGYTELGATTDDGSQVIINTTNFTDEIGTYSIYYDSMDALGNNAIQVIRTVNVVDTIPPIITLNGTNPQTIEFGDGYTELGATTNDGSQVTINTDEFIDAIGTYSIYYDSTDAFNNNAIQVNRTVNVVNILPPIITLNGTNPQIIELGDGYTELGATTNDGSQVTINTDEFIDAIGTYSIYYDSTDTAGNNATQVNRTVNVVDATSPTFSSATLDEGTGNLTITFNEKVNVHAINFTGLSIRDGAGTDIVTPSITELVTTINDMTISFNMTLPNHQSLIAFTSYVLDIDAGAVYDLAGNAIIASSDNPITAIQDTVPPILSFTSIAPNNGTQSIGDDIVIQITTNTYEAGLTLLNATINNATPTFSEWVLPSGPDYNYRKTITINNAMVSGSTDHTDFPLLVSIQNDPSLNSVAVQASGQDIRFTTIDDTLIDYEITSFSNNHTSGSLSAWVKIPTLSASTDTQIHMYYSNPIVADGQNVMAVWDSDYVGVWHYDGDILDSTGNNNDGTNYDSIETTGIIGGGRSFDGNDYISYDDSIFPSGSSPRTLSVWVNHSNLLTTVQALLVYGTKDTGQAYGLFQKDSKWLAGGYSDDITLNTIPTINNWHHLAMTYDGTTVRAYVDGSLDISAAKSWNTVLDEFRVGQQVNSEDQFFAGQLDEIRISDTVKTADWIKTEYDSQNSDSFYSVSVQQELVTPVYYNLTYNVAEGDSDIDDTTEGITYSITLSDAVGNPSVPLTATLPSISSPGVDANSPVITLNGTNPQTIEFGDGYTELGATTDDGSQVIINTTNFTDSVGTYSIYYDSMDALGNNAIQVIRTVNVVDTIPPIITLNGTNPQTIEFGDGYTELGATTNDGSPVSINTANFTDSVGTYPIYYDSTDTSGNNAIQVIRTVNVVDTTSPIITLNGTNPQTIEFGDGYTELGATTSDGSQVTINTDEFIDAIGTYSIYYDSTDASGNNATQVNRTVNVVDTTSPTFSSATLDEGTGNLTITFNEKVNVHAINFTGLSIRDGAGTDIVTPSITELVTTINDMTISFNMTLPNRQSLIAFTSYVLDIDAGTVYDLAGNAIIASSGNPITAIQDTVPPILSFTSIAPNNGTQSIGDDIVIQITTNTYEAGLTLLNATINNATPTFSEWVLPSGPDYNYRKTITINNAMVSGSTDHTDFPLLVSIQNDPSLNSVAVQASGQDIRFTTIDDTLIDYEITSFSNNHTSGSLSAWVKIPTLSASTDTQIHMYYSNPIVADGQNVMAVWDSDYVGVWHYDGDILDSTGNNNDGTNYDSIETTGIIGGGRSFDGNDYISYDDSIFPSGSSPRTLSVWVNHSNLLTTVQAPLVYGTGDTGQAYGLFQKDSELIVGGYSDDITLNTIPTINNWYHLAMTYDGTTVRAYVDGSLDISAAKSWNTVLDEFRVGQQVNSADQFFAGQLDEIRISDTVKTADWIKTEYDSQNSDSFYSVSVQQELVTPVYYNLTYNVAEGDSDIDDTTEGITYSITLSDAVGNPSVPLTATLPSISSPGVDANSPVITLNGTNPQTIEFGDGYTELGATTSDGSPVFINTANFTDSVGTYSIYYDSTDTAGNNATQVNRTVNVVDTTSPIITLNGTNPQTIEFGDGYTELGATTSDGSPVFINTANFTDSVGTYSIYYDSTDAFNNNATQVNRTVNVVDTTSPIITLNGTNPQTIEFGDGYTELGATTSDGSPVFINTANFTDSVGTYSIYYDSTDTAGNNATQVNRTVNVVDTTSPIITLNGTNPQTIEFGDGYTELGATTNDGSPISINTANFTDSVGTYSIYYDSTDTAGNNATQVNRTVNVVDSTPPVITLNGTNPQIIEFGDGYTELGATTNDGSPVFINTANFTDSVGTYSIYYDSMDAFNNNATQVNRTVNVVDTIPPVITLNGTNPQTIEFGDGYTELGATTNDGSPIFINSANFTDSVGTYSIYYDSTDTAGNNATQVNRTVNVVDSTPPVITLNGTNPQTIEFGDGYTELGATTNDGSPVSINTANFTDSVGTYSIYYDSMDAFNNNATQVNRTVNVVDSTPPVITLNGTNPQIIEFGDGYTELGATTDDGSQVTIDTANFTDSVGTYSIYYDSMDAFNNNATQVNRTVNVVDTTSPIITLNGTNPQTIEFGDGYTELGATTSDGSPVSINTANFTDSVGTYSIYYDSTDTAGNNATQVNRTVNVVDTTSPIITLNGTNPQTIEFGDGYTELGATTDDGSQVTIDTANFTDSVGTYSIYYDSMDAFNNNATQVIEL